MSASDPKATEGSRRSLLEFATNEAGVIEHLAFEGADGALLRAMGVVEGQSVEVLRRAPFGGPLHVRVGESSFALGVELAASVYVSRSEAQ